MKLLPKQKGIPAKKKRTRWPHHETKAGNELDLETGAFSLNDPRVIARSLRRSPERSRRRKSDPFQSAMSKLNFYIDLAGHNLAKAQRGGLRAAMAKLRLLYHRGARAAWVVVKAGRYELENAQHSGEMSPVLAGGLPRSPIGILTPRATRGAAEPRGPVIQENFNLQLKVSNPRNAPALVPVLV